MSLWMLCLGLVLAADTSEPEITFEPQAELSHAPAAEETEGTGVAETTPGAADEAPVTEAPTNGGGDDPPAQPVGPEETAGEPDEVPGETGSPPKDHVEEAGAANGQGGDAPEAEEPGPGEHSVAPPVEPDWEVDTALPEVPAFGAPVVVVGQPEPTAARESTQSWIRMLMPGLPTRGPRSALNLALATVGCLVLGRALRRVQKRLAPTGLLPEAVGITSAGLRVLASLLALGALIALVPKPLAPMIPVALIAAAAAIGWSFQELVQDVAAGVLLAVEQRIRQGHFVNLGSGLEGVVEQLGLRATWIRTPDGRQLGVPNREMVNRPVYTDPTPWPATVAVVRVPPGISSGDARATLKELAQLSPWVAPNGQVQVWQDPSGPDAFRVRARLIDEEYISAFRGALQDELLATLSRKS